MTGSGCVKIVMVAVMPMVDSGKKSEMTAGSLVFFFSADPHERHDIVSRVSTRRVRFDKKKVVYVERDIERARKREKQKKRGEIAKKNNETMSRSKNLGLYESMHVHACPAM